MDNSLQGYCLSISLFALEDVSCFMRLFNIHRLFPCVVVLAQKALIGDTLTDTLQY